jgi:hypothetical protein
MDKPECKDRSAVPRTDSSSEPLVLSPDQLARWCDVIACGDAEIPPGLVHSQEEELQQQVRQLRRTRLVQFIARQIALDIARKAGASSKR